MDMKKILQAFDGATNKPVEGVNDMKRFVSIISENANSYNPVEEAVVNSFEAGTVGGDANDFLLAADKIQDEVMAQVNKIKIHADEANLRDMMDKFNAFMTAYHNVGKEIIQPDLFNDSMGESVAEGSEERGQNRLWAMITDYEQRAKATKNDIKKAHYLKMASELRGKLKTSDEQGVAEGLSFKDYVSLAEAKKKITASEDPCWSGYKMVGTKKKGGKEVPNCVPGKKGD